jgi:iron(III) transport system substrate-binding protein
MRSRAALLLLLLAAAVLPACNSGGGSGSDADLTIYSGRSEQLVKPLIEMFEKDSGLDVEVRYAGSAELAAQLLEEGDNSPADVFFSQDAGALGALSKADALAELSPAQLGAVAERFRSDDSTWVGVSGRARVIAYNKAKVPKPDVPTSVFELTDPAWRGRVGFAPTNASFQSFVTAMRVLSGEDRTKSWLEGFKANEPQAYENNLQVLDAVSRGEVDLGLINHYYWFERALEIGKAAMTSDLVFLAAGDPGALVNVAGVGVLKSGDHKDAAAKLVDFLLGPKAQTYFRDRTFEYPLSGGLPPPDGLPPLASVSGPQIDLSQLDSLEETLELLDEVGIT